MESVKHFFSENHSTILHHPHYQRTMTAIVTVSVTDPNTNFIRIQRPFGSGSAFGIRIRIQVLKIIINVKNFKKALLNCNIFILIFQITSCG